MPRSARHRPVRRGERRAESASSAGQESLPRPPFTITDPRARQDSGWSGGVDSGGATADERGLSASIVTLTGVFAGRSSFLENQ